MKLGDVAQIVSVGRDAPKWMENKIGRIGKIEAVMVHNGETRMVISGTGFTLKEENFSLVRETEESTKFAMGESVIAINDSETWVGIITGIQRRIGDGITYFVESESGYEWFSEETIMRFIPVDDDIGGLI